MSAVKGLLLASALGAAMAGCGAGAQQVTATAHGTVIDPGASAAIAVGKTEGAQTLDVDVQHLAPPDRLGVGNTQFGVWVIPQGGLPVLAGRLAYDRESQRGQLHATTPHQEFEVLVTAEGETIGPIPSDTVVLRRGIRAP